MLKLLLTFQITAGWRREAFLRFTPHQFQAYLQHFHLLSPPLAVGKRLEQTRLKSVPFTCVQQGNKKVKQKKNYFSSLMRIRWLQIRSLCLSSQQKKRMVKSKATFSSDQLHVFSPPVSVLISSTYVRWNKGPKRRVWSEKSLLSRLSFVSWAFWPVPFRFPVLCLCIWSAGTTRAPAANKGPLSGSARCTRWHQLGPPTSSMKHTTSGRVCCIDAYEKTTLKTACRHLKCIPKYEALFER